MKLKKYIINVIGFSNYRKILTSIMRVISKIDEKVMYGTNINHVKQFAVSGKDTFFGYYDLKSISDDGTKLLSHVIDNDIAIIGYFDINTMEFKTISNTRAWNWQMGSRLRWYEDGKSVIFNDYDGKDYISRVVDIEGKELHRFNYPIYDMDISTNVAYFTDFTVLHHLREGYGYTNKTVNFEQYYKECVNGVYRVNLFDNKVQMLISIEQLQMLMPTDDMKDKYHYINHITINPRNKDIMFFHLWTDGKGTWKNRMIFMDAEGNIIKIITDFDRASHYEWKNENNILVSVVIKNKIEYRLYDYRTGRYELVDGILTDGHPTYLNSRFFITDTYPNRCAMQSVYICDSHEHTYKNIFSIYHSTKKHGVQRCDLHPRVVRNLVNIDTVIGEHRSQYLFDLNEDFRDSLQWERKLYLDKQAVIENIETSGSSLFACMESEYLYSTGRKKCSKLKMIHLFMTNPTFRANVYVCRMQKISNVKKRRKLRNKLELKHNMIVDSNCKIGIHYRADHTVGIVIGSGVIIGNYCKMYQNVTIGQKNGRFPVIGDHVVIYPGAKIIGDIEIGDYAVIGANAVVTKNVPNGATAVGVPARIIQRSIDDE